MKKNEVVILSIVIGLLSSCLVTYFYGINFNGFIGDYDCEYISQIRELRILTKYVFFISIIVFTGISYLITNRFVKK